MEPNADIAVIGLAVMGQNLILNMNDHGYTVVAFNRTIAKVDEFLAKEAKGTKVLGAHSFEEMARLLKRPRRVMLMVKAGAPVDEFIEHLLPHLEPGDIIIDGGNSLFEDTMRRTKYVESKGLLYIGTGVSGGEEGARRGPSIMPGGSPAAWPHVKEIFQAVAAKVENGAPCCDWVGENGAGHYVKMVHNGIEYGDMQLIAETVFLLRQGLGLTAAEAAQVFESWNAGELESYLVAITAAILRTPDPESGDGSPLVDAILDQAAQKGTGTWTVRAAADLAVPIPTVAAAVEARSLSADRARRITAADLFPGGGRKLDGIGPAQLRDALYAAKTASYAQGFDLLRRASDVRGYGTPLADMARIWTAGCIIRARFLEEVAKAFTADPAPDLLAFAPFFAEALRQREGAWREVVAAASLAGIPIPGLSASLAWFDSLRTCPGSASLIQAQRDFFGSHTYERRDRPGHPVHTAWPPAT